MGISPKTMPNNKGSIMGALLDETNYDYLIVLEKLDLILEQEKILVILTKNL